MSSPSVDEIAVAQVRARESRLSGWRWSLIAVLIATLAFDTFVAYEILRLAALIS